MRGIRLHTKVREEIFETFMADRKAGIALAVSKGLAQDYCYKLARERGVLPRVRGPRLNFDQRRWLVYLYRNGGYEAAKPYAIKLGISPRYVCQVAKAAGHTNINRLKWLKQNDPQRAREIYWTWTKDKQADGAPNPTNSSMT